MHTRNLLTLNSSTNPPIFFNIGSFKHTCLSPYGGNTIKLDPAPKLKETEYGFYIREKWRSKKKRTQKTHRFPKNLEKVVIAQIGTLEIYVYPYQFPNQVFLGLFPINVKLSKYQANDLMRAFNTIRWYLEDKWTDKPTRNKKANALRRALQKAYLHGEQNHNNPKKQAKPKKKTKTPRKTYPRSSKRGERTETRLENGAFVLIK